MPSNSSDLQNLVDEMLSILLALGIPLADLSRRRCEKMAKAFLAVAGIRPGIPWAQALINCESGHKCTSRQVIQYMNGYLGEHISSGSYDDIRRKDLALPVEAGIVLKSASNPNANTNDGTRAYALSPEAARQISYFGTAQWEEHLTLFHNERPTLASELARRRQLANIPVQIGDGVTLEFSPGAHNQLQKQIIEVFLPTFGFGAKILYVGDTINKYLFLDKGGLGELGIVEIAHDKLPDIVAYSSKKNWIFFIEAVTTANPISELRRRSLLSMCTNSPEIVFVTAFPNRNIFRTHVKDIAWETEAWIADVPEHMVHFNGDKFIGPYVNA